MNFGASLIGLILGSYLQCINLVWAKDIQTCFTTFMYEFDDIISLSPLTFIIISSNNCERVHKIGQDTREFQIKLSPDPINCLTFTSNEALNLTSNSIILDFSSGLTSGIIYHKCSNPSPYIFCYFDIDEEYLEGVANNKPFQNAIIEKIEELVPRLKDNRRLAEPIEEFNYLVNKLGGCVACAIIEYDYLELMTSDELSNIYLLFISYFYSLKNLNTDQVLKGICDALIISRAAVKLVNLKHFNEWYMTCYTEKIFQNIIIKDINSDDPCFSQIEKLIESNLDLINLCIIVHNYYNLYDDLFYYGYFLIKSNYLMGLTFFNGKEFELKHKSNEGENGRQIEVTATMITIKSTTNSTLKLCYNIGTYVCDLKILLKHHWKYGDLVRRFIFSKTSDCKFYTDESIEIELYEHINFNTFIYSSNGIIEKTDSSITINYQPIDFNYYFYFINSNCLIFTNGTCFECNEGYCPYDNDNGNYINCINCKSNCLYNYLYPDCLICSIGFGLDENNDCVSCVENCKICNIYSKCLICHESFYLNSNSTCSPCKKNCLKCTFNYCWECYYGLLDMNNNCVKCIDYCSMCTSISDCSKCFDGYYLRINEDYNTCIICQIFCEICNENGCISCQTGYYLNYIGSYRVCEKIEKCENCLLCDENFGCINCLHGYILKKIDKYSCVACPSLFGGFCNECNNFGECIGCIEGYTLTDNSECVYCSINCLQCSEKNHCIKCSDGHYLNDKFECVGCQVYCKSCPNGGKCKECYPQEFLYYDSLWFSEYGLMCQYIFHNNCSGNSFNGHCKCNFGWILNDELECIYVDASNCLHFSSDFKCYKCKDRFFLNENSECINCVMDGCLKCSSINHCIECESYAVLNENFECISCYVENCFLYSYCGTCTKCNEKYYLKDDSTCLKCFNNCKHCSTYSICTECFEGYYLNDHSECKHCQLNCKNCDNSSHCNECYEKYNFDSNLECFYCGLDNCNRCSSPTQCLECNSGFFLNDNFECVCNATNCAKCSDINNCIQCEDGYYFNTSLICDYCQIENCKNCSGLNNCTECATELFLNSENKCDFCDIDNCYLCENSYKCKECNYNYFLNDEYMCVPCNVPGCKICSNFYQCEECYSMFYLTSNLKCNLCYVKNCLTYSGCKKCIKCRSNYYFVNYSTCKYCGDDCNTCKIKDKCLTCYSGFYLTNTVCTSCGKHCSECNKDQNSCKSCLDSYCLSTGDSPYCGKHIDCLECLTSDKCSICANILMIVSEKGCKCINGYFRGPLNNCLKCSNICLTCTNYNTCINCTALNSTSTNDSGCICNEGYYKAKEMSDIDACQPCENFTYTTEINAVFLESFIDVVISFESVVFNLSCENLFSKENPNAKKFGLNYVCEIKSEKKLFIELGLASTLVNETVEITNFLIERPGEKCIIPIDFQYLEPLPSPSAVIFAPSKVLVDFGPVIIDGKASIGAYRGPLEYHWSVTSDSSDIQDYSNVTDSSIIIPQENLKVGTIEVKLTVTNKFKKINTIEKQISCESNTLIIDFSTVSNYSCKVSQRCEFFINKIIPFYPNDRFEYSWKISFGEDLQINTISILNMSSIVIRPNSFKQGTVGFTVKVKNQDGVSGSNQIFVDLISEKPVIVLDRSIGSISSKKNFSIDASKSFDPNLNCESYKSCLNFEWICYKKEKICNFEYDKYNNSLLIPENIVKNKQFDSFHLLVKSSNGLQSTFILQINIVDIDYVPIILIREYFTKTTPSRIPLLQDFVVEAAFIDGKSDYPKQWVLSSDKNQILSENSVVFVNKEYLKAGFEYKLTFNLIVDNVTLHYFYDFTVNSPPRQGQISVEPKNGSSLVDKFTIIAADWIDSEQDYPLLYAFGYCSENTRIKLISKQSNQIFSTYLSYIGDPMYVYAQVYDSLGDNAEVSTIVSVENSKNTTDLLEKMKKELSSEMIQNIPSLVSSIATGILNKELYIEGNFSNLNSSEVIELQKAFDLSYEFINKYIEDMESSKDFVTLISSILAELTMNLNLKSSENAYLSVQTVDRLLNKSEEFGLFTEQMILFYKVLENSFSYSFELIRNNTKDLNLVTTTFEKINKGKVKNIALSQSEKIDSSSSQTHLYCLESNRLGGITYNSNNVSVSFPSNYTNLNLKLNQTIVVSLTYIPLSESENVTQNLAIISVFDQESSNHLNIYSDSSIGIEIPFDQQKYENMSYTCLYFNYYTEEWDNEGCIIFNFTEYTIICECKHLSTFTAGIFKLNAENNFDIEPEDAFNFFSYKAIGLHICLSFFTIYIIFAIICYKKDKKEIFEIHSRRRSQQKTNFIRDSINIHDLTINQSPDNEKNQVIKECKDEKMPNADYEEDSFKGKEISNLNNEIDNEESETKTSIDVIKEGFKEISIYFYTDPEHCRLFRCSSRFFQIIGNIFFTSVFFNVQSPDLSFENTFKQYQVVSFLSINISFIILSTLKLIFHFACKEIDLNPKKTDINDAKKKNRIKVCIAVTIHTLSMGFFCYETGMIVYKFEFGVNIVWVVTIVIGLVVHLTVVPIMKIFINAFLLTYLKSFWAYLSKCISKEKTTVVQNLQN